jgi:hypothetical protein
MMQTKDFKGQDLRGRSFKNQDLTGADFSDCDLRGVDFSHAYLKNSKFCNARMGRFFKAVSLGFFIQLLSFVLSLLFIFSFFFFMPPVYFPIYNEFINKSFHVISIVRTVF